jgi:hypothetical protein
MVHVLASNPREPAIPVIFNVDGAVGAAPAANHGDDVVLVKAFLKRLGDIGYAQFDEATSNLLKSLVVNGVSDSSLINAIRAFQTIAKNRQSPAAIVDGRVSPAKSSYQYSAGTLWTIVNLNYVMKNPLHFGAVWPCIHLDAKCPPLLAPIIKSAISGPDL